MAREAITEIAPDTIQIKFFQQYNAHTPLKRPLNRHWQRVCPDAIKFIYTALFSVFLYLLLHPFKNCCFNGKLLALPYPVEIALYLLRVNFKMLKDNTI